MAGYQKVYGLVESSDFVTYKGQIGTKDCKEIIRVSLDKARNEENGTRTEVFPHIKESTQFQLIYQDNIKKQKKTKLLFKVLNPETTLLWIKCLNKFT